MLRPFLGAGEAKAKRSKRNNNKRATSEEELERLLISRCFFSALFWYEMRINSVLQLVLSPQIPIPQRRVSREKISSTVTESNEPQVVHAASVLLVQRANQSVKSIF